MNSIFGVGSEAFDRVQQAVGKLEFHVNDTFGEGSGPSPTVFFFLALSEAFISAQQIAGQ